MNDEDICNWQKGSCSVVLKYIFISIFANPLWADNETESLKYIQIKAKRVDFSRYIEDMSRKEISSVIQKQFLLWYIQNPTKILK